MARRGENIYKRKDGRYEGRYVTGKKDNGQTKFGYVYGRRYGDVRLRLIAKKAETQKENPCAAPGGGKTLKSWMNEWMEGDLRGGVKPSSYQTYLNQWNRHISPKLGGVPLSRLTPGMVREFVDSLCESGLSENTVRGVHRLLCAGLRAAQEEGHIRQNPCKKIRNQWSERREQRVLNPSEQKEVEAALSKEDLSALPALLSLYTGMRLGEVCALKWSDIDWPAGTVTVRRTVQRLRRAHDAEQAKTELFMFDDIRAYPGKVHITISGTAASAATVLSMAADHLEMSPGSLFMIHDPSTVAWGDERDMNEALALLRACKESILNMYATRCTLSRKEIAALMTATTWMDAKAALEYGFIDGVVEDEGNAAPQNAAAPRAINRKDAEIRVKAWLERRKPRLSCPETDEGRLPGEDHTSVGSPAVEREDRPVPSGGTAQAEDTASDSTGTPSQAHPPIDNLQPAAPGTPIAQLQKRLGLLMPTKR